MNQALHRGIGFLIAGIASLLYATHDRSLTSDVPGNAMGAGLLALYMLPFLIFGTGAMVVGSAYLLVYAFRRIKNGRDT